MLVREHIFPCTFASDVIKQNALREFDASWTLQIQTESLGGSGISDALLKSLNQFNRHLRLLHSAMCSDIMKLRKDVAVADVTFAQVQYSFRHQEPIV